MRESRRTWRWSVSRSCRLADGGAASTRRSDARARSAVSTGASSIARCSSAAVRSAGSGDHPRTVAMPACFACRATEPPIAPSPMTPRVEGRTAWKLAAREQPVNATSSQWHGAPRLRCLERECGPRRASHFDGDGVKYSSVPELTTSWRRLAARGRARPRSQRRKTRESATQAYPRQQTAKYSSTGAKSPRQDVFHWSAGAGTQVGRSPRHRENRGSERERLQRGSPCYLERYSVHRCEVHGSAGVQAAREPTRGSAARARQLGQSVSSQSPACVPRRRDGGPRHYRGGSETIWRRTGDRLRLRDITMLGSRWPSPGTRPRRSEQSTSACNRPHCNPAMRNPPGLLGQRPKS